MQRDSITHVRGQRRLEINGATLARFDNIVGRALKRARQHADRVYSFSSPVVRLRIRVARNMTHVVTDNCHLCRFTDCVAVCPVECFHADEERTYIDPDVCIDCGACIPACPVHAIYETIDMPDDQRRWVAINAERSHALPVVYAKQDPLPTAAARRAELGY